MYKIGDYLRVRLPDGARLIGTVHTESPLIIQQIGGTTLYHEFEVIEQLSRIEVEELAAKSM